MNVKAAAKAAGISPSGLRWYEAMGVLPPATRSANGYRKYTSGDVSLLRLVRTLRALGLSAAEAGRLAKLTFVGEADADNELAAALQQQREAIAERRADLDWLDGELRDLEATWRATRTRGTGHQPAAPISVLFLCNVNSGRSQIAEALLTRLGGERFRVQSAGSEPAAVSDMAVAVLAEVGIDWRKARAKHIEEVPGPFDYVISLADSMRESCAAIKGPHSTLHWHLPDPAGAGGPPEARIAAYRRVRDELSRRLVPFVELALRTAATEHTPLLAEVSNG
ncbi:MAG: MerR family transcriptional regulator [Dehalococcoidia bacterium]|nr:MerR family transcriptional regulator [Dehalococcoidia bacterium]